MSSSNSEIIFDDVSNLVDYLPGTSAVEIAEGISDWMDKKLKNSDQISRKKEQISQKIDKLRFSRLSIRLYSMIRSLEINQD